MRKQLAALGIAAVAAVTLGGSTAFADSARVPIAAQTCHWGQPMQLHDIHCWPRTFPPLPTGARNELPPLPKGARYVIIDRDTADCPAVILGHPQCYAAPAR